VYPPGGFGLRAFFFSSRRRHTRSTRDWSSDVCSSDLLTHGRLVRHVDELSLVGQVQPEVDRREERSGGQDARRGRAPGRPRLQRSEEHTSELDLVCRLLLENKNTNLR